MPPEPIELPDDEGIPRAEGFEAGCQPWSGLRAPRGEIVIEPVRGHPRGQEGIALEVEHLRAIRF
jgi:hypothetical protein